MKRHYKVTLMWIMLITSAVLMFGGLGYCWWILLTQWR